MKKLLLIFFTAFSLSAIAQTINCSQFCVLSIDNLDTVANEVDVTIWSSDSAGQVNYPTVVVVDAVGDTVANIGNLFFYFAQMPGDTLVHTIPSDWDSIPAGFIGTVYLTDQIWDTTCSFSYPMACTVGINEYASTPELILYPNPVSDRFSLKMPGMKGALIRIYDIRGQLLRSITAGSDEISISRGDLQSGIYLLDVTGNNGRVSRRIVLE